MSFQAPSLPPSRLHLTTAGEAAAAGRAPHFTEGALRLRRTASGGRGIGALTPRITYPRT